MSINSSWERAEAIHYGCSMHIRPGSAVTEEEPSHAHGDCRNLINLNLVQLTFNYLNYLNCTDE